MSDEEAPGRAGARMGTGMLALFWVGVLALGIVRAPRPTPR